jgi:hypothetical protein
MAKKPTFADIGRETDHIDVRLSYKIVELFSEGLYASPNKAIEELVANAFDAGAQDVQVLISDNLSEQNATIVVIDDGEGMNASELMRNAVKEAARVLSPGGKAVYVVGENTVRGTFIANAKIVSAVAELSGLKIDGRRARELPANRRYLPPPAIRRNAPELLDGRMRREVILSFSKS